MEHLGMEVKLHYTTEGAWMPKRERCGKIPSFDRKSPSFAQKPREGWDTLKFRQLMAQQKTQTEACATGADLKIGHRASVCSVCCG